MGKYLTIVSLATALCVVAGCGGSGKGAASNSASAGRNESGADEERAKGPLAFEDVAAPTKEQEVAGKRASAAINQFGFALAKELVKEKPDANHLVSPLSVASAHAMLLAGAKGDTATELQKALGFAGTKPADVHTAMFALGYGVTHSPEREVQIANAMFALTPFKVEKPFEATLKNSYDAEFVQTNPEEAVDRINGWAKDKTAGMIPKVFDTLDPQTVFVLVDALTFIGRWEEEFDPDDTQDADFTLGSGKNIQVPTMRHKIDYAGYYAGKRYQALTLPYKSGHYKMAILLPNAGTNPTDLLKTFDETQWRKLQAGYQLQECVVELPKFAFDADYDLIPALQKLGVKKVFGGSSDLAGVAKSPAPLWVYKDVHLTHIEVDEKGTKAAAVTADATKTDAALAPPKEIKVDRPFLFAIVHQKTGVVVFLGICQDPRSSR